MRVIAGKLRSRTLEALAGLETRPTYDRLKETLFNVLASAGMVQGRAWADLFAGTGSVGIEALSRGATSVHFAESGTRAIRVLRRNLAAMGLTAGGLEESERSEAAASIEVAERDAAEALRLWEKAGVRFDVCFLDPPYQSHGAYGEVLRTIARGNVLCEDGIVVAEHDRRFDPGEGEGELRRYRLLKQGDSALSFYRRSGPSETKATREPEEEPDSYGW